MFEHWREKREQFVTNKRVIFQGSRQTRECRFDKLIGVQHDDAKGETTLSVSNRQKPTTIVYGPGVAAPFDLRLSLALAHYKGTVAELVSAAKHDLEELERGRPAASTT
jgi:hypothetical protein